MTKEELETLRNKHRQEMVDVFYKALEIYRNFGDRISKGEILTNEDWKELVGYTMKEVLIENDIGEKELVYLDSIFHKENEEEV